MDSEKQKRNTNESEEPLSDKQKKITRSENNPQKDAQQRKTYDAIEKTIAEVVLETMIKGHISIYTSLPGDVWRSIGVDTGTGQHSLGYEQSRQLKSDIPIFINADEIPRKDSDRQQREVDFLDDTIAWPVGFFARYVGDPIEGRVDPDSFFYYLKPIQTSIYKKDIIIQRIPKKILGFTVGEGSIQVEQIKYQGSRPLKINEIIDSELNEDAYIVRLTRGAWQNLGETGGRPSFCTIGAVVPRSLANKISELIYENEEAAVRLFNKMKPEWIGADGAGLGQRGSLEFREIKSINGEQKVYPTDCE